MTPKVERKKMRLELLLLKLNIDHREIAKRAGVDPKTIWELRRRKYTRGPRMNVIAKVAPVLGISADKLWALVADVPYKEPKPAPPAPAAPAAASE